MTGYDKELINSRILEVCDYYLPGEGKREGTKRRIWHCPLCGGAKFAANFERQFAGCLSAGCEVPRTRDAVGIIAYFEELELKGEQFVRCLRKGYEILGIPDPDEQGKAKKRSSSRKDRSVAAEEHKTAAKSPSAGTEDPDRAPTSGTQTTNGGRTVFGAGSTLELLHALHHGSSQNCPTEPSTVEEQDGVAPDAQQSRELVDRVYRTLLELCPLVERDREFWHSRGVNDETIAEGGFGSLWRGRCHEVLEELERRFGEAEMTSVAGFYRTDSGQLRTNLYGDYTLIPYYDREGYVTTVEGRVPGKPEGDKPKYMAPVGAANHLYVFPRFKPQQVVAFCEGLIGAVIAAQCGIPVGAIKGCRCYRTPTEQGKRDLPLPELRGVDFERRRGVYIPDLDVKAATREEIEALAPEAARWLVEEQNGTPLIARLPEGYKDLDEWLLALEEGERLAKFAELVRGAITPKQWSSKDYAPAHALREENREEAEEDTTENPVVPEKGTSEQQSKKAAGDAKEAHRPRERGEGGDDRPEGSSKKEEADGDTEPGDSGEEEQRSPAPGIKRRQPQTRAYKPIPKTNIGEFTVALILGLLAALALLILVVFVAPEWGPTSFVAVVPAALSATLSLMAGTLVVWAVCERLYKRRWYALREHLAGRR